MFSTTLFFFFKKKDTPGLIFRHPNFKMENSRLLNFDQNSSIAREIQFDMIYRAISEETLSDEDIVSLFSKIVEFDFTKMEERDYFSLVKSIGLIYQNHFPLVKSIISPFLRNWKNFTQIMLTIEYLNEIDEKDDLQTYRYFRERILNHIIDICINTSTSNPYKINEITIVKQSSVLLLARCLAQVETEEDIADCLLDIYADLPICLASCVIPYIVSVNQADLIPLDILANLIRDRKTHGSIFHVILSELPDSLFEKEHELLARTAKIETDLLPILLEHAKAFKEHKDILADFVTQLDGEFPYDTWEVIYTCEQKFSTPILKKHNISDKYALVLAKKPQDFLDLDKALSILTFSNDQYYATFFKSFEFTSANQAFFNQPAILAKLAEHYRTYHNMKKVENLQECPVDIDMLADVIVNNYINNLSFFNHFVSSKCTKFSKIIKFYNENEMIIVGGLESIAYAITAEELHTMFTSDEYVEEYHLLLEILLYRKTSKTNFDDPFVALRIPEILTPDLRLYVELDRFFNEALENNFYIHDLKSYTATIREFYYAGQFINIFFEGHIEWRFSNLSPTNFMIVVAMSCIYCELTESLKENPLTFASSQPLAYIMIIPMAFHKSALKIVYETFNQRCIRILDKQITIFFILIFTTSLILDNFNEIPPEVIVFIIKELEVLTIQGSSQLLNEYRTIIKQILTKNGKKILTQIAQNVKVFERYGVYETLDLNIFPTVHVLQLLADMRTHPNAYEQFKSRVISPAFRAFRTDKELIYAADARKDYRAVYNIVNNLGYQGHKRPFTELLHSQQLSNLSLLIVANNKIAPNGDLLLSITGIKRLCKAIVSLMTYKNEYNMNIAQLIQNVISKAASGDKKTNYGFFKRFLELPFLSIPYKVVEPLYGTSPCQEVYLKAINACFVRVSNDILMKKDWRNFPSFTEFSAFFVEYLFRLIINKKGQLAMGALICLIGQHTWMIPRFVTNKLDFINLILDRCQELENVDKDNNLGYDAFQSMSLLNIVLFTAEMRQVFFCELVPNIAQYSLVKRIIIALIIAHHLIDARTQLFTYTAITHYVDEIAKATIIPKISMNPTEQRLLLAGTLLLATIAQINKNLDPFVKSLSVEFLKHKDFFLKYCHTDGTCTSFNANFSTEVFEFIFRIRNAPLNQFSVTPRTKTVASSDMKDELIPITQSDDTVEGIAKHLPMPIQIRLMNKKLPPRPEKINVAQYIELFNYGLFTVRYFCSPRVHLILPQYVQPIIDATEAIKKFADIPDPEPIKFEYGYTISVLPKLLSYWHQLKMIDDFTTTIVISLIDEHGEEIIDEIIKSRDIPLIAFLSIVKSFGQVNPKVEQAFKAKLLPNAIDRCVLYGNSKLGYTAISTALTIGIEPLPGFTEITKSYLQCNDKRIWYRGLKLIPLFPQNMQHDLINICFKNVSDLVTATLFLMVCPNEGPKRSAMFISILKDLLAKKKEDESISIITDSLTSPYDGTENKNQLLQKDPKTWELIIDNIEWMWEKHKEKNLFKFITRFQHILPFARRVVELRKAIDAAIFKESIALLIIQNQQLFENSLKMILSYLNDEQSIHSRIYIKFPEMQAPESGGVLRGWFTTFAEEMVKPDKGLFIPSINGCSYTINPQCKEYNKYEGIGRFIGIVVLHGEILGYQLAHHLIKHMIGRDVDVTDLADYSPAIYETITWIQDPNNDPSDLCLNFTVDSGNGSEGIELCEGGKDIMLTRENTNEFIDLLTQYYLYKESANQIDALKKGFQFVLKPSLFTLFTSTEIGSIICGEQKTDVEELIKNFDLIPPLTPEHPIVVMFFKIIRRWNNDMISRLLLFMTSAHTIPVGGYEFMKAQGRQPKLKLASMNGDKYPLPSALTCFSHLSLPPYPSEEEMEKSLIMAITESEGFK